MLIVTVALCLYGWHVSDDGTGADRVRGDINAARDKQQSAIDRLEFIEGGLTTSIGTAQEIARGLGGVEKTIGNAQDRIGASEVRAIRSAELIGQGKSILDGIRKRGQVEN